MKSHLIAVLSFRDLRRDLKAPKMPVVVAAAAYDDGKIHDAQMEPVALSISK